MALLASLCCLAFAQPVRADQQIDVGPSPILNVHLTHGKVTISTWDRPQVQISSNEPVNVRHIAPADVDPGIPKQLQIFQPSRSYSPNCPESTTPSWYEGAAR